MPLKHPPAGKLISFEGSEGSGKSTQITRLAERLTRIGREVVATREPGGTEIGEQIRNIIVHNSKGDEMCPETELLLFTAARAQVVRQVIAPALTRGAIVLSDRFLDSSTVYQGIARNLAPGPVEQINRFAVGNVMPDLTIVLDVSAETAAMRMDRALDRMEKQGAAFHARVRQGFLAEAARLADRTVVIDATGPIDAVQSAIRAAVESRFAI